MIITIAILSKKNISIVKYTQWDSRYQVFFGTPAYVRIH